jgi:hypothetical protein
MMDVLRNYEFEGPGKPNHEIACRRRKTRRRAVKVDIYITE